MTVYALQSNDFIRMTRSRTESVDKRVNICLSSASPPSVGQPFDSLHKF